MLLDDHLVKVQAMMASPFAKPFEAELIPWEKKLSRLQDILDNCETPSKSLHPLRDQFGI